MATTKIACMPIKSYILCLTTDMNIPNIHIITVTKTNNEFHGH